MEIMSITNNFVTRVKSRVEVHLQLAYTVPVESKSLTPLPPAPFTHLPGYPMQEVGDEAKTRKQWREDFDKFNKSWQHLAVDRR